ncbi:hypothetical protein [Shouchella shacheensis]|uniref:hypothetical protein n=1 Tax=Shouchella shacheensis TaxID=1649580 RepID=UPI0012FBAB9D|nr:hypothetical protein [Shouchella shacheensis]
MTVKRGSTEELTAGPALCAPYFNAYAAFSNACATFWAFVPSCTVFLLSLKVSSFPVLCSVTDKKNSRASIRPELDQEKRAPKIHGARFLVGTFFLFLLPAKKRLAIGITFHLIMIQEKKTAASQK